MQDTRTLNVRQVRRTFRGLGATSAQLLAQDQTLKAQIQSALAGNPVPGNPFPNATPQQLALALAGSTPWKPWNQSGTIEKAIANTVAMFSSEGGADQILRTLQIAAGSPVTVGQSSPGVKVVQDAATTQTQLYGLAALLNTTVPPLKAASAGAPAPTPPNIVQPAVPASNPSGLVPQLQPPVPATVTGATTTGAAAPADGTPGTFPDGTPGVWQGGVLSARQSAAPALSSVLANLPAGTTAAGLQSVANSILPGGVAPQATSSPGILDFLSAPINLPVVGPVPTWGVGLGLGALVLAWRSRNQRGGRR